MTTEKNTWVLNNWLYFVLLLAAEWVAADPASPAEFVTYASAYVSGTVTSQASGLPLDHWRMVVLRACESVAVRLPQAYYHIIS